MIPPPWTTSAVEQSGILGKEEATKCCRICLMGIDESSGEWFQMDCACKGELAAAHVDCAVRWFGIRGNASCDVCCEEIGNLPCLGLITPQLGSSPALLDEDDDDYYDPIDSSCTKIAVLVASSTFGFFKEKLRAFAEFP